MPTNCTSWTRPIARPISWPRTPYPHIAILNETIASSPLVQVSVLIVPLFRIHCKLSLGLFFHCEVSSKYGNHTEDTGGYYCAGGLEGDTGQEHQGARGQAAYCLYD